MKVLLLSAGESRRLQPLTNKIPKSLLKLGDKEIMAHLFDAFLKFGMKEFHIVTGHGHSHVKKFAKRHPIRTKLIRVKDYKTKGNVHSVYCAREIFKDDFILLNTDTIFHHDILKDLLKHPKKNVLVIDDYKTLGEEEMKVYMNGKLISKIHKKLDPKKSVGEYIGLLKISKETGEKLIRALEKAIKINPKQYYEDALQILFDWGVPFHMLSTKGRPCMEIDTHEDLAKARKMIKKITNNKK